MAQQRAQHRLLWDDFALDLRLRRLLRGGYRVRLQPIPLKILTLLLERPGEVVTRDDLHHRIWNGYSCGDFDHSLNIAINKLRVALGDSVKEPRYIETLPQMGYRFLGRAEMQVDPSPSPLPAPVEEGRLPTRGWAAFLLATTVVLGYFSWRRIKSSTAQLGKENEAPGADEGSAAGKCR